MQALYDPGTTTFASAPAPVLPPFPANMTFAECAQRADCTFSIQFSSTLQGMFAYHFFGLLWTNQFITGLECAPLICKNAFCLLMPRHKLGVLTQGPHKT
jgi:hypothetical protein